MKNSRRFLLFTMFLLLPVTLNYFSPYVIIDGLVNKIISGAFIVWATMFVSSLFFGRAFCSYICPYGGLQMTLDRVIQKPLKDYKRLRMLKYILGIIWVGFIVVFFIAGIDGLMMNILYLTENVISVDEWAKVIGYYVIVIGISIAPVFLGKRATCHYLCPMSILNIGGAKLSSIFGLPTLKLVANSEKCVGCNKCSKECPMSLKVMDMVKSGNTTNNECILCGECAKNCSSSAIERKFGRKSNCQEQSKHQRIEKMNL